MSTTPPQTREQDRKHVGAVLDRRYVLVEPTGREAEGARFIAYDMQQMTHVDVIVQQDANGELAGDVVEAGGPDEARAVPAAFQPGGMSSAASSRSAPDPGSGGRSFAVFFSAPESGSDRKGRLPRPASKAVFTSTHKSPAVLALLAAGRPRPSFLQTLQLTEADMIEVGLLDRPGGAIQPEVLQTLQLTEADLMEVGLLEGDAPRSLLFPGRDELAAIEQQFRRLLRRRAWVVAAAVLGLSLVASVVWMLCRAEPAPGPAVVRSAAPAETHPTQELQHAVKRVSQTLRATRPAAQPATPPPAVKKDPPPPPAVKKDPPPTRSVARSSRPTPKVAKQSPRRRARPAAKPRVRRSRRRAVDADALLASARRPRRGGAGTGADAILASAWASTRRASNRRLQRKTVDPFAE